jgi:hypothetical protein
MSFNIKRDNLMRSKIHMIINGFLLLLTFLVVTVIFPNGSVASAHAAQTYNQVGSIESNHLITSRRNSYLDIPQSASFTRTTSRKTLRSSCNPCGSGDLKYHNGAVQNQPKAYLIFWGASWKSSSGNLITPGQIVKKYFNDVSGTKFENILTQYYMQNSDGSQTYISNTLQFDNTHIWIDTSAITPTDNNCIITTIEDTTLQSEISKAINNKGWPSNDYNTTYFVYTPSGYTIRHNNQCSSNLFSGDCGYHTWTSTFVYAAIPYPNPLCPVPNSPNGNGDGDSLANTSSHEQFEAITDPTPGAIVGGSPFDGWYDSTGYAGEIGDKCNGYIPGTTKLKNGGIFELQEEYSDATDSCVNTFTPHLTVNTTADYAPPCAIAAYSFRCAILQLNNENSGKPIWFNIPSSDSGCKLTNIQGQNISVCTIAPGSSLPNLTASNIVIDGYTQPGARPNTKPLGGGDNAILTIVLDGSSGAGGLVLGGNASNDTIKGLQIINFNYAILIGASTVTNNNVSGNFIGTDGVHSLSNNLGIYIAAGSSNNIVGGTKPASINLISGNFEEGVLIGLGTGNTVEGNYFGTDSSGTSGIPNGVGVYVFAQAANNLIGGILSASANIIAFNGTGIVTDNSSSTSIIGNKIEFNFTGVVAENGEGGDSISRNIITKNSGTGILVGNSPTDNVHVSIRENSIFANGGLGIDLYPDGIVNCSTSTLGGPNDYLPCPIILSATTSQVSGTAFPNSVVEVYTATNEQDDQGHGEGKTLLGTVTADGSGNWKINLTLTSGKWITATATYTALNGYAETSEFAANVKVS